MRLYLHTGINAVGLSREDNSLINLESNYPYKFWTHSHSYCMRSTCMDCCGGSFAVHEGCIFTISVVWRSILKPEETHGKLEIFSQRMKVADLNESKCKQ